MQTAQNTLSAVSNHSNNASIDSLGYASRGATLYKPSVFADTVTNDRLLERCRKDDKEAIHTLLSRFEGLINSLAYRMAGNYDDAGDIAAEAYIRLCSMLGTCRSAAALPTWVRRVVSNAACDLRRRSMRTPTISLDGMIESCGDACLAQCENKAISPENYAETQESNQILYKAISTLPVHHQSIIKLFYLQELSHEEISDKMGIKVGTVKSRLNRAREALQNKLSGYKTLLTM